MLSQFWGQYDVHYKIKEIIESKMLSWKYWGDYAYIRIAKSTVVGTNTRTFVKARFENFQDADQQQPYMIENMFVNDLGDCDIKVDHFGRNIELPIENYSDVPLKLKKGTLIGSGIGLNVIEAEGTKVQ